MGRWIRARVRRSSRGQIIGLVGLLVVLGGIPGSSPASGSETPAPLAGFSFAPAAALALGRDPATLLATLLDRLDPDLVRLPVAWSDVAPGPATLDYATVDSLRGVVARHNQVSGRGTRLVLVVGARNLGYPELFVPSWIAPSRVTAVPVLLRSPEYLRYVRATVTRYARDPLLYAWQVENEPLDEVTSGAPGLVARPVGDVAAEVGIVRAADPGHRVVVTTYNSATVGLDLSGGEAELRHGQAVRGTGHPAQVLGLGDVLGLDLYVVTPTTPLNETSAATRISWKKDGLDYWADQAEARGESAWIMEMQAAPWQGKAGFTPADLVDSAIAYSDGSAPVVLFWGVENWPVEVGWMDAGSVAIRLVRHEDPGDLVAVVGGLS